jgi:hypothetical protein
MKESENMKERSITHSEFVFVELVIQHAKRMPVLYRHR